MFRSPQEATFPETPEKLSPKPNAADFPHQKQQLQRRREMPMYKGEFQRAAKRRPIREVGPMWVSWTLQQ